LRGLSDVRALPQLRAPVTPGAAGDEGQATRVTTARTPIVVVAAVIERDGRFLLGRRLTGTHLAGFWEFPGGKCDPGETHESCLRRELREELGVESAVGAEIVVTEHAYPDRTVRLHFRRCRIEGDPRNLLGQDLRWVTRAELTTIELPEADRALVELLVS
jgi:8-oxo-dGTP diphosphatase